MRRSRRRQAERAAAIVARVAAPPPTTCWLCDRPLGATIEWHHFVPRSRGGRETVAVHPICHRTVHVIFTNHELARLAGDRTALRADERFARFLTWIADKPADFHAPTRRAR